MIKCLGLRVPVNARECHLYCKCVIILGSISDSGLHISGHKILVPSSNSKYAHTYKPVQINEISTPDYLLYHNIKSPVSPKIQGGLLHFFIFFLD